MKKLLITGSNGFVGSYFIHKYKDIYQLSDHRSELIRLDGYGAKSIDNLLESIEKSRNVKLENFITALSIPNIGLSAAKAISKKFNGILLKN